MTRRKVDHDNTKCYKCGNNETYMTRGFDPAWHKYYDEKGNWDKKSYICGRCYQTYDSNSHNRFRKLTETLCRNEGLSIDINQGKGVIGEAIVGKIRKLNVLSITLDNFNLKFDLSSDLEFGIIQVKTRTLIEGEWEVSHFNDMNFDYVFLICMDYIWKNIERVYIFPKEEIIARRSITISKNPSRGTWYDSLKNGYRIDDKPYNEAYQDIMRFLEDKKYFGVEDIKKWMGLKMTNKEYNCEKDKIK